MQSGDGARVQKLWLRAGMAYTRTVRDQYIQKRSVLGWAPTAYPGFMMTVAKSATTQLGPSLQNPRSKLTAVPNPTGTAAADWMGSHGCNGMSLFRPSSGREATQEIQSMGVGRLVESKKDRKPKCLIRHCLRGGPPSIVRTIHGWALRRRPLVVFIEEVGMALVAFSSSKGRRMLMRSPDICSGVLELRWPCEP